MEIEVIETARGLHFCFTVDVWEGRPYNSTSSWLSAPQECVSEKISIVRAGNTITEGAVSWVGTHGALPQFCDLRENGGNIGEIFAKDFEVGDKVIITPIAGKTAHVNFDRIYWSNMLALAIQKCPYED